MTGLGWGSFSTIRVRLAAALAAALLPVLILGVIQSAIAFNRERVTLRENLGFAAERSAAATARSRMEGSGILLPGRWRPHPSATSAPIVWPRWPSASRATPISSGSTVVGG